MAICYILIRTVAFATMAGAFVPPRQHGTISPSSTSKVAPADSLSELRVHAWDTSATSSFDSHNTMMMPELHMQSQSAISEAAATACASLITAHGPDVNSGILSVPAFWSLSIMLTIVSLLYVWEESVEYLRDNIPKTLQPVVESILSEIAGLGFIGLLLDAAGYPLRSTLEHLSEEYLGNEEILLESFEFLHMAFFQVGVGFFITAGIIVAKSLQECDEVKTYEGIGIDSSGSCMATTIGIANILDAKEMPYYTMDDVEACGLVDVPTLKDELFTSAKQRGAKVLLAREYLVQQNKISELELIEPYISKAFGNNLLKFVELSPLTWIPLIPALALANAVDLSHDVVNSSSANAVDSAGFFFSTPAAFYPSLAITVTSVIWGCWNFWHIFTVKTKLLPSICTEPNGEARLLPPRAITFGDDAEFVKSFPYGNYLSSIQYHTWLCITSVVFFGTQVVSRDIGALISGSPVGDPQSLLPELMVYGMFFVINVFFLLLSRRTFLSYTLAEFLAGMVV